MNRCLRALLSLAAMVLAMCLPLSSSWAADKPGLQEQVARANDLMRQGKPDEAWQATDAAPAQAETLDNPAAVVSVLVLRMGLQMARQDYPGAEASAKRGFALADGLTGPLRSIGSFIALHTTTLYLVWGRPAQAEPWALRAVAGLEALDRNGSLHQSALAVLRSKRGDAPGAQAAYAEALPLQASLSEASPTASNVLALARIHGASGRDRAAQEALDRAVALAGAAGDVQALAFSTSPDELAKRRVASDKVFAWREIGRLQRDRGQLAEAEEAFRRALAMAERLDGPGNANMPAMRVDLGDVLRARAARPAAEQTCTAALSGFDTSPDGSAAHMPQALDGLARARWALGKRAEAGAALRREIGLYESYIAAGHPQLAPALELLAEMLTAGGQDADAKAALVRAAAIRHTSR